MPFGISYYATGKPNTKICKQNDCTNPVFRSKEEMHQSVSRLCYGNLHVIGRIWIEAMKSVLVGSKMCLVPTVAAQPPPPPATANEPPTRPPKMKYKDLPLYEKPHYEYKQHEEDEVLKCVLGTPKILQEMVFPTVRGWRQGFTENICEFTYFTKEVYDELAQDFKEKKDWFKAKCRCPEYLMIRRVVVAAGATAGFVLGSRKNGYLYQKLFWGSCGALSTGWLCMPEETDKALRTVCYESNQIFKALVNAWYGRPAKMDLVGPCDSCTPPIPPPRVIDKQHSCEPEGGP